MAQSPKNICFFHLLKIKNYHNILNSPKRQFKLINFLIIIINFEFCFCGQKYHINYLSNFQFRFQRFNSIAKIVFFLKYFLEFVQTILVLLICYKRKYFDLLSLPAKQLFLLKNYIFVT